MVFTLVELVAVIVLLGILAVAALPRFIDLRGDARSGVLQGVVGSLQSAAVQVYAKALIQSSLGATGTVTDGTNTVDTVFGYPAARTVSGDDISDLVSVDGDPNLIFDTLTTTGVRFVGYDDGGTAGDPSDDGCYVTYTDSVAAGTLPVITITDTGC